MDEEYNQPKKSFLPSWIYMLYGLVISIGILFYAIPPMLDPHSAINTFSLPKPLFFTLSLIIVLFAGVSYLLFGFNKLRKNRWSDWSILLIFILFIISLIDFAFFFPKEDTLGIIAIILTTSLGYILPTLSIIFLIIGIVKGKNKSQD